MKPGPVASIGTSLLLTVIWGTTWAAIRISLNDIPPLTGVALRFALAGLVLLLFGRLRGVHFVAGRRVWFVWISNALLSFCFSYVVIYWCEQWVPSGLSSVLWATFPLFMAGLAHFFLAGERLTIRGIAGAVVGFSGVAVIFSEDFRKLGGSEVAVASAVILLSPIASAVSNVIIKRRGAGIHPVSVAAVPMLLASIVVGAAAAILERSRPVVFTGTSVAALLYLAIIGSAVAFGLYYWLLAHHRATTLALISYGTPVVGVLVGAVWLHEPVTIRILLGSVLVVAGVAMAVHRKAWKKS